MLHNNAGFDDFLSVEYDPFEQKIQWKYLMQYAVCSDNPEQMIVLNDPYISGLFKSAGLFD